MKISQIQTSDSISDYIRLNKLVGKLLENVTRFFIDA